MSKLLIAVFGTFVCGIPLGLFVSWAVTTKVSLAWAPAFSILLTLGIALGAYIDYPPRIKSAPDTIIIIEYE